MSTSTPKNEPTKAKIEALTKEHRAFPYSYNHEDLKGEIGRLTVASKKIHRIHESRFEAREDGHWEDETDIALRREHWVVVSLYDDIETDVLRALRRMRELEEVLLRMPENPHAIQRHEADAVEYEDEEWTVVAEKQNNHVHWSDTDSISARIQQEKPAQSKLLQVMTCIVGLVLLMELALLTMKHPSSMALQRCILLALILLMDLVLLTTDHPSSMTLPRGVLLALTLLAYGLGTPHNERSTRYGTAR